MADLLSQPGFGLSQYYDQEGFFLRFDSRVRLLTALVWLSVITATPRVWGLACGCLLVLSLLRLSKAPLGIILRNIARPMIFILLLVLVQILFSPAAQNTATLFKWGPILVNSKGIEGGLKLFLRFTALYMLLNWMTAVLSATDIVRALARLLQPLDRLGLPTHDFVLLVQVSLHFLPLLSAEIERIAKAQASRGAVWSSAKGRLLQRAKQTLPILLPMFISTLHRAERLAQAIEARGYGKGPRTSAIVLRYSQRDTLAGMCVLAGSLLILFL